MRIHFPEQLPVSKQRAEIQDAIQRHQVVIVCGDTGSGKTTQLPKIALNLARGAGRQRIGCTQPRRLAATSVARRVADEMAVALGSEVGYQIRFEDRTSARTAVKFMTDGILLAETRGDNRLRQYDTLIIDEAHERSLNIDFILGYLHRLLPQRKDLKIVISSATLDAGSFSTFFGNAPVIQVEGRTFPVEDHYLPPMGERETMADHIARAVEILGGYDHLGDTLVFLPGEREIRDATELLQGRKYRDTIVLPLFARQAGKEQQLIFQPVPSKRRIILATNVAETSLTIPDIRFVVDTGLARVNRYDPTSGIQRLLLEKTSQASARQRRGRCGRVSAGICVRLYDEEDFNARKPFTDPEILRSNLAGVVLQMEHLGLGDPLEFPFIDRPQPKRISQAYQTLDEIGALQSTGGLTEVGDTLARLPLDPRVGRILVAAREENCLREALIVASALTVQDPRERPQDQQEAADQAHAKFRDPRSDLTAWLNLWFALSAAGKSNNAIRKFGQANFMNYRRTQEWISLHGELSDLVHEMDWPVNRQPLPDPRDSYSDALHRAVLASIPSHLGANQGKKLGFKGARDRTFFLHPASGLFSKPPTWVMAFEIVETSRLYGRNVAAFDPTWMESVAPHVCRYRYSKPHWMAEHGAVYGEERVMAFGLTLIESRRVHFGRIDPVKAREIFIWDALIRGQTRSPLAILANNRKTRADVASLEHKLRRRDGLLFEDSMYAFYDQRLPAGMCTQKEFEKWVSKQPPGFIDLEPEDCMVPQLEPVTDEGLPEELISPEGHAYPLVYLHDPGSEADGITVRIPLLELNSLQDWFGDWLVPAWLPDKVNAMLRALDKNTRLLLPAMNEVARGFLDDWDGYEPQCGLTEALMDHVQMVCGHRFTDDAIDPRRVPVHLQMRFEVHDDKGQVQGSGRSLNALRDLLAPRVQAHFRAAARRTLRQDRVIKWDIGALPDSIEIERGTLAYPALYDRGEVAALRVFETPEDAAFHHPLGLARLVRSVMPERIRGLEKTLFDNAPKVTSVPAPAPVKEVKSSGGFNTLAAAFGTPAPVSRKATPAPAPKPLEPRSTYLSKDDLFLLGQLSSTPAMSKEDLVTLIIIDALGTPVPRDAESFERALEKLRVDLYVVAESRCGILSRILRSVRMISGFLDAGGLGYAESLADGREHFQSLLRPGWIALGHGGGLERLEAWMLGLETRLDRLMGAPPVKDLAKLERFQEAAAKLHISAEAALACPCGGKHHPAPASEALLARENDLRLQHFAPEVRARMGG